MPGSRRVLVWMTPEQATLVRAVARIADLEIVGAGSPSRGHAATVAAALECQAEDDLRAALASTECDLVWLAAPGTFGSTSADETASILAANARGVKVATIEPVPGAALDLRTSGWLRGEGEARPLDLLRFCPLTRTSPPFREAPDLLETFGDIDTLTLEFLSGGPEGSLGAQLFGALELVHLLMGEPETIEAAYVSPGPGPGRALHALPGETLRDLHGDAVCTLRFADGRAAGLLASDRAGAWSRTMTLIGRAGRIRMSTDGFEWVNPSGETIDSSPSPGPRCSAADVIAASLSRLLDSGTAPPPPTDHAAILALAQASLLSCRTGQAESPATIRRMAGVD